MGRVRVTFESPDPSRSRLEVRLKEAVSAIYYGFFSFVCYLCEKAATTVVAKGSCNRQIRRGKKAKRCSRACILAAGLALVTASPIISAQEPLYDIDIPSLSAAEALNELAAQTGAVMLFPYDLVVDRHANSAVGRFTLTGALEALLEGSGLSGGLSDRRVVQISVEQSEISVEQSEASTEAPMNRGETAMLKNNRTGFWGRLTASLGLAATVAIPAQAQVSNAATAIPPLDEIVVTARKREENLQEVPVSITVINANLIQEAGLINPRDIFEMTPGLSYAEAHDRASSNPSIRGVQSRAVSTLRQKVTSFMDGMPLIGSQGTLQLTGLERVEIFRGPQSAAFGRATFAGAINYVSRDPGDEFEGDIRIETSDLGRNSLQVLLGGPISDTVGYTLNINVDEYDAHDDWVASEGFGLHGSKTDYINGKLKFTPSDNFDAEIQFTHLETDDEMPLEVFLSEQAWADCTNFDSPTFPGERWINGTIGCDFAIPAGGNPTNIDTAAPFRGTADELLAQSYAITDPGISTTRDRIQGEFNFRLANDTVVQLLGFVLEERKDFWVDVDRSDAPLPIMGGAVMGMAVNHMASPADIEEQMVEVRWLSPDTEQLRWMVGASVYEYEVLNLVWSQYDAIINGYVDDLLIPPAPSTIFFEESENIGVFGSINYDISDRTTLSFEGRWQTEDLTNINPITNESFTNTTDSFLPRIAITHTLPGNVTLYAQASQGNNPAGVIPQARSPRVIESHAQATALGLINWSLDSVLRYDEEVMTNLEFGVKATLAENRVTIASTIYTMDWENYNQPFGRNWDIDTLWEQAGNDPATSPGRLPGFGASDYRLNAQQDAGDVTVVGWENEVRWQATDNWTLGGTLTWQDAEYDEFCSPQAVDQIGFVPTDLLVDGKVLFDCVNVVGNSVQRQPELTYTLNATYRAPLGNTGWQLLARVDWRQIGEQFLDDLEMMELPKTDTLNASVNFRNDNWNFRIWGRNLTDDDTPRRFNPGNDNNQSPAARNFWFIPRDPAEYGVQLSYSF